MAARDLARNADTSLCIPLASNAAWPKEEYREFALINQRRISNLGFKNLAKLQNSSADL